MPNKTIYVSEKDVPLFERAKEIAGVALSSVLVQALSEYVSRHEEREKGIKEISVKVGSEKSGRVLRFNGLKLGDWEGFSQDNQWWLHATIYKTQKEKYAVHLIHVCKASLLTNKQDWIKKGEYLVNTQPAELIIGEKAEDFKARLPDTLIQVLLEFIEQFESPIEYLDI